MEKKELRNLSEQDTLKLCQDIRDRMIDDMSRQGGYLSDNLAAVDVTIALNKVFESNDFILFSHESLSYAQKILCEKEYCDSVYDNVSLAEAMGMISAKTSKSVRVVYVMSDEDILDFNLIRQLQANGLKMIVVYLDRHEKDVNALNKIVNDLRQTEMYNGLKKGVKKSLSNIRSSEQIISGIHRFKDSIKRAIIDEDVFERYNIDYLGPIHGHDHKQLSRAFQNVKKNPRLVVVHCMVKTGKGYAYAEKGSIPSYTMPFNRNDGRPFVAENDHYLKPFTIISKSIEQSMNADKRILCLSNDSLDIDGMADLFARYPDRCMRVKTEEEDLLKLSKGIMEAGKIPVAYIEPEMLDKYAYRIEEIAGLKKAALFYTYKHQDHGYDAMKQIRNAYILHPKDCIDLKNDIHTAFCINEPMIIIVDPQCMSYEDSDPIIENDVGKWRFLVNNDKRKAVILGYGTDLIKIRDIIVANELPYDLIECECLNRMDEECMAKLRKTYKHIYFYGTDHIVTDMFKDIEIIDGDMEEIFARIKKDIHA
ncbi:MAG: hypothetical protein IKS51_07355 [Erysipelotrichaceae bacterium]|nr:hypothetical protein [Erysipelotrichaceae bacterium]